MRRTRITNNFGKDSDYNNATGIPPRKNEASLNSRRPKTPVKKKNNILTSLKKLFK